MTDWTQATTTTHQDHVIAHVIGATVLGYFILDETLYVLLDIGFIWNIYVDGEMGLLPHPVVTAELDVSEDDRKQIRAEIELLLSGSGVQGRSRIQAPPANCLIEEVTFFTKDEERRLFLSGEVENLAFESSLASGEIKVT